MKLFAVILATCGLGLLVSAHAQDPVPTPTPRADPVKADSRTDLDKLQGTWQCTSWISNGMDGIRNPDDIRSSYDGNRLTLWSGDQEYRHGLVTLDPGRTPKAVNTWDLDGPYADETNRAIYDLDGDTLKVCISLDRSKSRPTEFESKPDSNRLLVIYKRVKP